MNIIQGQGMSLGYGEGDGDGNGNGNRNPGDANNSNRNLSEFNQELVITILRLEKSIENLSNKVIDLERKDSQSTRVSVCQL